MKEKKSFQIFQLERELVVPPSCTALVLGNLYVRVITQRGRGSGLVSHHILSHHQLFYKMYESWWPL